MEEFQESKHVCKFCKKIFPCGRSLGGHMKSHTSSSETEDKINKKNNSLVNDGNNSNSFTSFEAGFNDGYDLRKNPKKTCRISYSREDTTLQQEKLCKKCGKGFQSWKSLFCHVRCHSKREKILDDDSWTGANQKLVIDSQSETSASNRKKRSRRKKKITTGSFSLANASSSVSEIEQEQEEGALNLMMLSRDLGYRAGSSSFTEHSDNNSMVLEKPNSGKVSRDFVCNNDENVKLKKPRDKKLKSGVSDSKNFQIEKKRFGCSGSGFQTKGFKEVESKASVHRILREQDYKTFEIDIEAKFEVSNVELGNGSSYKNNGDGKKSEKDGFNQDDFDLGKKTSSKRLRTDRLDPELGSNSCKKTIYDASVSEIYNGDEKKIRFECSTCNKIFHSYHALGGHKASHKVRGCSVSRTESSENAIETEISSNPSSENNIFNSPSNGNQIKSGKVRATKKNKSHECSICFKVFASGQALGGHKRSHFVGLSETRSNLTVEIHQSLPKIHDVPDLNLPVPND